MKKIVKVKYVMGKKDLISFKKQMLDLGIMSIKELADKTDFSCAYIHMVLNGDRKVNDKFIKVMNNIGIKLDLES